MSDTKPDINTLKEDGEPENITIVHYWKYEFRITFTTDHYDVTIRCGGSPNDIYKFNPFGGWNEWEGADNLLIEKAKRKKE